MLDPSLALNGAVVAWLKADAGVSAMIAGRIYDTAPKNAAFPYVTFGGTQVLPDKGDCVDGTETTVTVDAWSQKNNTTEIMKLGNVVAAALDDAEIPIGADQRLVDLTLETIRYVRDPDGVTRHAIITFHALTEPV